MSRPGEDDFYVGYLKKAPPGLASALRKIIGLLLLMVVVLAAVITLSQKHFSNGHWDFSVEDYSGWLTLDPYPSLLIPVPEEGEGNSVFTRYHLVNPGKFVFKNWPEGDSPREPVSVNLQATRIEREGQVMLEVVKGSVEVLLAEPVDADIPVGLGRHTFVGEIVDSKCYLGVMNPGNLKTHKSCAIRCISGGIPPVLVVRDEQGQAVYLMLTDEEGKAVNERVLNLVAEPVEITGAVSRRENLLYLAADPADYKRL